MAGGLFLGGVAEGVQQAREAGLKSRAIGVQEKQLEQQQTQFDQTELNKIKANAQANHTTAITDIQNFLAQPGVTAADIPPALLEGARVSSSNMTKIGAPEVAAQMEAKLAAVMRTKSVTGQVSQAGAEQEAEAGVAGLQAKKEAGGFELEAELEGGKERAKLAAKRENLQQILGSVGLTQEPGTEPAIAKPFGGDVPASKDASDVSRLLNASLPLLLAGETELANGLLSQARILMANSPDIQRQKELDKPISSALAAALQVPAGTVLRDVMDMIPPSTEEEAFGRSKATAQAKAQVEAGEQLGYIQEAQGILGGLMEKVKETPQLVGIIGEIGALGQRGGSILSDLGFEGIIDAARSVASEQSELPLDSVIGYFEDPTLSVLSLMENSLGMIWARLQHPTGRIPVEVITRSIADVNLTGFRGSGQVMNRLKFIKSRLDSKAKNLEKTMTSQERSGKQEFSVVGGKLQAVK